jgi:hypothetical protein
MVLFFARYAQGHDPQAVVFACSLASQAVALCVQAVIGAACLRNQLGRTLTERASVTT